MAYITMDFLHEGWDHSFPLENTKSPHPRKSWKITQKLPFGPGTVLKTTEKLPQNYKKYRKITKSTLLAVFG